MYKPKESGPNRRVTMGVRRRLTNCEMIGTEDSVSTSWTKEFEDELTEYLKDAVKLEIDYAKEVLPTGILGLNAEMFVDYMQYIGNRRLEGIGIEFTFDSDNNPFPWLSEVVDTGAMTNFFERKVKDYQSAGMLEEDF